MAKYLVIVESPAKVKTIKKFLGSNYEVIASQGHVRDLPKSTIGIDVDHDYDPKYITIRGKGDVVSALRKETKKAEKIYLATDPDREGEAISWHLYETLKMQDKKVYRITFNEITKNAVKESLKNAREINMNLVDAQQARRVLDRMVGYRISPLLWAKVKRGLSAGRVQSVTLRMICDREDEINAFIPKEYWTLGATFSLKGEKKPLIASFYGTEDEKMELNSKEDVEKVTKALKGAKYEILDVKTGKRTIKSPLPFTTSTLQQEANKSLGFATSKTMRIAQQLYEGVDIKGEGTVAFISYLRTDSTRVSDEAKAMAKTFIEENYGGTYCIDEGNVKKEEKRIQDAHEAIRPTDINRTPELVKNYLSRDQYRLYQLIWKRFAASRMAASVFETVAVRIKGGEYVFRVSASKVAFDGYRKVYSSEDEEKAESNALLNSITKSTKVSFEEFNPEQHFTQPPAHFTESSLVRAMEEQGIGRPSTYAPTISTIMGRHYVLKEDKNLYVSELGEVVNNLMKDSFPSIVDTEFTANMEALLDKVEEGTVNWKTIIRNFYPDLDEAVKTAEDNLDKIKVADEESDEVCELCGRKMVYKYGPHGKFLACPGFPECRNTKTILVRIGVSCPKCGKDIVERKTKKGRRYYGCEGAPDCDFMIWQRPSARKCPKCGNVLVTKGNRLLCATEGCGYSEEKAKADE
ncbi:MAG: type I DNA topoisomerase [Lachnospiraceae bacterium]|nr:type I DNA topoisomerase [Lachnospiraceae bacterium]